MRIVKVGVLAPTNKGVPLGVQGESCATEVEFDVRPWLREYPSGTVSAVARREGDPAPYPLTLDVADGMAVWVVSDTDTAKAGEGAVELTLTSAGTRVRSLTFKTLVTASLTDAPVDDDAWYGWLDKAVVKVDETVQAAQRKMAEVDEEWTGLKADVNAKVDECSKAAAQAAEDAHRAKVDAQATAKALESAGGSAAKAEDAAKRAEDAALYADDSAVEASKSAQSAGRSAEAAAKSAQEAKDAAGKAVGDASASLKGYVDAAAKSAGDAATSASNAATSASAAAGSAEEATAQKVAAETAKDASETFKAGADAAKGEAAKSAGDAAASAAAAAKSAEDAAASAASAINVIAPKSVDVAATNEGDGSVAVGAGSVAKKPNEFSIGSDTLTREVTHVSEPTEDSSAVTKFYVDANTSNALVSTLTDTLVTVDDAVTQAPLSLSFKGVARQDGTPSVDNPVEIQVVTQPVVTVAGKNLWKFDSSYTSLTDRQVIFVADKTPFFVPAGNFIASFVGTLGNADAPLFGYDISDVRQQWFRINKNTTIVNCPFKNNSDTFTIFFLANRADSTGGTIRNFQFERGTVATAYEPYSGQTVAITLPEEHPYLASLPNGTADEVVIDAYGNATLVARVGKLLHVFSNACFVQNSSSGAVFIQEIIELPDFNLGVNSNKNNSYSNCGVGNPYTDHKNAFIYTSSDNITYIRAAKPESVSNEDFKNGIISWSQSIGGITYAYPLATTKTYNLGKVSLPSLKAGVSNVWIDGGMGGAVTMTYKQDANKVIASLKSQIAALTSKAASDETAASEPTIDSDPEYSTGEPTIE